MAPSANCSCCRDHEETFLHCVRDCRFSSIIWHKIGFSGSIFSLPQVRMTGVKTALKALNLLFFCFFCLSVLLCNKKNVDVLKIVTSFQHFIVSTITYWYIKNFLCIYNHIKSSTSAVQIFTDVLNIKYKFT